MLNIPLKSFSSYVETVTLDGKPYKLAFRWNGRDASWMMSIMTGAGVMLLSGVKLVPTWDLIGRFVSEDLPPGGFVVADIASGGEPIGRDNLGDKYKLYYFESSELN